MNRKQYEKTINESLDCDIYNKYNIINIINIIYIKKEREQTSYNNFLLYFIM